MALKWELTCSVRLGVFSRVKIASLPDPYCVHIDKSFVRHPWLWRRYVWNEAIKGMYYKCTINDNHPVLCLLCNLQHKGNMWTFLTRFMSCVKDKNAGFQHCISDYNVHETKSIYNMSFLSSVATEMLEGPRPSGSVSSGKFFPYTALKPRSL